MFHVDLVGKKSARSLRIAHIHAADFGGGAERSALGLHKALRAQGHDSTLNVGYRLLDEPEVVEMLRTRTVPGLVRVARWFERITGRQDIFSPGFRQLCRNLPTDTDVVHLHSLWGSGGYADLGALPALTRRFPAVLTLQDEWMLTGHCAYAHSCDRWQAGCGNCPDLRIPPAVPRDGTRANWRRKRRMVSRSRLVVTAVSGWLANRARRSPVLAGKDIRVIYNSIDTRIFSPGDRRVARLKLGVPENQFIVLLTGQTVEGIKKNIAGQAVLAVNQLAHEHILPLIVGHSAERRAKTLNVPSRTLPFQKTPEDMADVYRSADLTLVSSEVETFGCIAAESQACGTPVLTFAAGGLPEVVQNGTGGYVVPCFDIEHYARTLRHLCQHPEEVQALARGGREWVVQNFDDRKITQQYEDLYRECIEHRGN